MGKTDPRKDFHDLMLEVLAYRWKIDPSDRDYRLPALLRILNKEMSDVALSHMRVEVAYNRAYWERQLKNDTTLGHAGSPIWAGWDEECVEIWFPQLEPLQAKMTTEELSEMERRFEGFGHCVSMHCIYKEGG